MGMMSAASAAAVSSGGACSCPHAVVKMVASPRHWTGGREQQGRDSDSQAVCDELDSLCHRSRYNGGCRNGKLQAENQCQSLAGSTLLRHKETWPADLGRKESYVADVPRLSLWSPD